MARPQRNLLLIIVPCALFAGWLAFGDGVFSQKAQSEQNTAGEGLVEDHLQQAADSIVAVAKERVAAAKNDDEAIQRARLSIRLRNPTSCSIRSAPVAGRSSLMQ
jgi:hypothetical protein